MKNHLRRNQIFSFIFMLFFILVLGGCSNSKEIDFKDYVGASFGGYETRGKAHLSLSLSTLEDTLTQPNMKESEQQDLQQLLWSMEYSITPNEGLSNGDTTIASVTYSETLAKKLNIKFLNAEQTFQVERLEEPKIIDVFQDLDISFEGVAPFATLKIKNLSEDAFIQSIHYSSDKNHNLKIGEVLKIEASYNATDAYIIQQATKEYIVENTDEYLQDYTSITPEINTQIQRESLDLIESTLAKSTSDMNSIGYILYQITNNTNYYLGSKAREAQYSAPELTNIYFSKLKPGEAFSYGSAYNHIYFLYKVTVENIGEELPLEVYLAVGYKDTIKRADATIDLIYSNKTIAAYNAHFDDLYRDLIIAKKDKYETTEIPLP